MIQRAGAAIALLLAVTCLAGLTLDASAQQTNSGQKHRVVAPTVPQARKSKEQYRELQKQKNDHEQARRTFSTIQKQKHDDAKKVIQNLR